MVMDLSFDGPVATVTWADGENRINLDSLARLHELLDEVVGVEGPVALVWTGTGKFFSNGLDLERFGSDAEEFAATLELLYATVARLLLIPVYSVAAINGHAFAGGALLSCAVDYRVMRADRGYWCMNEMDIGLPLGGRLASILFNRLPRATAIHAIMTAHRYAAPEALTAGIVEEIANEDTLLSRAVEVADAMSVKDRSVLAAHKRIAYGAAAAFLTSAAD